jgi:type I restriction enzyme, S subunit
VKEWEKDRISSKAIITPGYAFDSSDFMDNGIPIVKIANVKIGSVDLSDDSTQYVDEHFINSLHPKYRVRNGDILISLTGSHLTQPNSVVGRVGRYRYEKTALVNQRAAKIDAIKGKSDKDFVFHLLSTFTLRKEIAMLAHGAANQANVSHNDIEKIKVFWPPFPIQRKIAAVLSAYDDLIENNNRCIAILEEIAAQLYREWFVRLRFPGHEKVKVVKGVPDGWKVKRIGEFVSDDNIETGKRPKGGAQEEGVPSIGAENVIGIARYDYSKEKYVPEDFFHNMKQGTIKNRDILFYKDGAEIGRVSLFQDAFPHKICCVNEHVFLIRTDDSAYQYFLYFNLARPAMFDYVQTINKNAAQPGINQSELKSIPIIVPPKSIITKFNGYVSPIISKLFVLSKEQNNCKQSRERLIARLMSGKIDVEKLDIHFPASMIEEVSASV